MWLINILLQLFHMQRSFNTLSRYNCHVQELLIKTVHPPPCVNCTNVENRQRLWYNKRACSIKTTQSQLDLTSDNTPIDKQAHGDSTSVHNDKQPELVTQTHNIQQPMSAATTTPTTVFIVCVHSHLLFIATGAHEASVSDKRVFVSERL